MYDRNDGVNWTNNTNWLSTEPLANWFEITVVSGKVTQLDLHIRLFYDLKAANLLSQVKKIPVKLFHRKEEK